MGGQLLDNNQEQVVVRGNHDLLVVTSSNAEKGQVIHGLNITDYTASFLC